MKKETARRLKPLLRGKQMRKQSKQTKKERVSFPSRQMMAASRRRRRRRRRLFLMPCFESRLLFMKEVVFSS